MSALAGHEISFEELVDYVEGRLAPEAVARISAHLATGCQQCTEHVLWLRRVLGLMASDRQVDAPPALIRQVQALYRPPQRQRQPSTLASLWAWLRAPRMRAAAAVALATLLVLSGTWWAWGNASVAQAATLEVVEGTVEVRLTGSEAWRPAVPGMKLPAGSAVRSGQGAWCALAYADGSRTWLAENAQIELLMLSGPRNGRTSSVRLSQLVGYTLHEMARQSSSVQVQAATGTAQATAANYEVWVIDGEIEVYAERGLVELSVGGETARLEAGEYGWVAAGHVVVATPLPEPTDEPKQPTATPSQAPKAAPSPAQGSPTPLATPSPEPTPTSEHPGRRPTQALHPTPRRGRPSTATPAATPQSVVTPTETARPQSTLTPTVPDPHRPKATKTSRPTTTSRGGRPTKAPEPSPTPQAKKTPGPPGR